MEEVSNIGNAVNTVQEIQRLSIVDSIDSLYLFTYKTNGEQFVEKHSKSNLNASFFKRLYKKHGDLDYRLYYSSLDFEILPRELFLYGNEETYMKGIMPLAEKGVINFTDKCTEENLVVIYPVDALYDIGMRETIRGLHTFHLVTPLLKSSYFQNDILYVYIMACQVFVLLKKQGKWTVCYTKKLENDLSSILEVQYELLRDKCEKVVLLGDIKPLELAELQGKYSFISSDSSNVDDMSNCIRF